MSQIDFDKEFEDFVATGDGNAIRDIYGIIPSLSNAQMKVIHSMMFYIERYDLKDLREYVQQYLKDAAKNKNLSFMGSMNMKNLLKAYTMEKLMLGVRASTTRSSDE